MAQKKLSKDDCTKTLLQHKMYEMALRETYKFVPVLLIYDIDCARHAFSQNVTAAMKVTSSGPQTLQMAQGEPVTLDCTYTSSQADIGELDIEWSVVSPDTTKKDQMIISYTGGRRYTHGDRDLMKGVDFTATDPSQGDASLSIASLTATHDGTYQCKVKKAPGVDSRKISLIVMGNVTYIYRISSFRSGVAYSQVGQTQNEHPPSTNTSYSTAKYDSRFGYAV
ncbi:coxsackievirus and adenovirus receptor homolog [Sinocyclocheilus grahami]|uniref:coxsackievirus and adenovirus receptor homolog n=1 Tax=Sinocyclocheilus grahami TaxID=75366 RepID=UPI0007ACCA8C|nr:PREDICTED: coxsackievirus and adenovirus receptor homolog [Sinocyclocheilus grahami]